MPEAKTEEAFKHLIRRYMAQAEYAHHISEESPFFPQHVHIEPTNACNLRCVHCHHHEITRGKRAIIRPFGMMDIRVYRKVINEIAPLNCSITLDLQGEPTLHPQIIEMIAYATSKGVFTSLLTNATKLTVRLTQTILDLKLNRIVFSFDGVNKEVYESIRKGAVFGPTLKNLLIFVKLNHEQGHHTHICASIILQERTANHLEEYTRFFGELPIDKIFVSNLLNLSGGSGASQEINIEDLQHGEMQNWPICRVPWENIVVNWDGIVTTCPLDYNVVYPIGDVKTKSLQEIWHDERMRQFRRAHIQRNYIFVEEQGPLCGSCNCLWDPEYDFRRFPDFAVEAIYRNAVHFAPQFVEKSIGDDKDYKYDNLLVELAKLGGNDEIDS